MSRLACLFVLATLLGCERVDPPSTHGAIRVYESRVFGQRQHLLIRVTDPENGRTYLVYALGGHPILLEKDGERAEGR